MRLTTAQELRDAKIATHVFREGYDMETVDALLDSAAATVDYLQHTRIIIRPRRKERHGNHRGA